MAAGRKKQYSAEENLERKRERNRKVKRVKLPDQLNEKFDKFVEEKFDGNQSNALMKMIRDFPDFKSYKYTPAI